MTLIKKFIDWIKTNWYFYFLLILGFLFYIFMIYIRFFRKRVPGPIMLDNFSLIHFLLYLLIGLLWLFMLILTIRITYSVFIEKEIQPKNPIIKWFQQKGQQFKKFYEEVLTTTFSTILSNFLILADFIEYLMPYFIKFIRSHSNNLILVYLISIIPLIVSSCFVFDIIYLNKYYYFYQSVILLIIPFLIYIILFIFKSIAKHMDMVKREDFDIETNAFTIEFSLKDDRSFANCTTEEDFHNRMQKEATFYSDINAILYQLGTLWPKQYQQKISVLCIQIMTRFNFFLGASFICYSYLILYFSN